MTGNVYKTIEITGSSNEGIEAAIQNAVRKAAETLHNLRWFEVTETRGHIKDDDIAYWQVTLKLGFTLDD
jgi:flavin-binding protein dodecin